MRRRPLAPAAVALFLLVLAACHPLKDPPPPPPPSLPAAPIGLTATPALLHVAGHPDEALGAPDPDVISVDPSWCTLPPPPDPTTTTTTTTSTTSTTATSTTTTTTTTPVPPPTACYYLYTTPTIRFVPTGVPVYRSTDLVHWTPAGPDDGHGHASGIAFDGDVPGAEFPLWAPSVLQTGPHRFVMWFAEKATAFAQMCLWSATANNPDGPFVHDTGPWCKTDQGGVIDPSTFVDGDGSIYLTYKTEGLTAPYVPTRIFAEQLNSAADVVVGGTEHELVEVMPAPSFEYPIVEAPTLMRGPDGKLFLLYSANNWFTADYSVSVARCDTPAGPCNRVFSTPLLASRGAMLGPGGQTPFRDANGNWQLAFHAWAQADLQAQPLDGSRRTLRVLPIEFPSNYPQIG
jgi:beta-xylosidase